MATKKKDFTKSTEAIDKFFTPLDNDNNINKDNIDTTANESKQYNYEDVYKSNNNTNINNVSKHTNVSKHYSERGKREERYGLLLDKQLKEDIRLLSNATDSKSVNDFIVTVLLEYVERDENQKKLKLYKQLLQG